MIKYISSIKGDFSKTKFKKVTNNYFFAAPFGGLYAATYDPRLKYKTEWNRYCKNNNLEYKKHIIFELKKEAKIYVIDSQKDLIDLVELVGKVKNNCMDIGFQIVPDFEAAAKLYDAIYLSHNGQIETNIPKSNRQYNLYEWKTETLYLMNYDIIKGWKTINVE